VTAAVTTSSCSAWSNPLDVVPDVLTNIVEQVTGDHDPRVGRALTQVLLAGERFARAGLRSAAQGKGLIATGSSALGTLLPFVSIGVGVSQVVRGWSELSPHQRDVAGIIQSKVMRTGMLQVLAGALLFVPGVGGALSGAGARLAAAANEMDWFDFLDAPRATP
jgi:hypothetical protein